MQSSAHAAWVVLPFAGLLLSIALMPAFAPRFWLRHMGTVAAGWSLTLIPVSGFRIWSHDTAHAVLASYLPFIAVLGGLYVTTGGILLRGAMGGRRPAGRAGGNTMMLAFGTVLALVMGTAGAALVIIQPLLRANAHRRRQFHLVLFTILLVGNTAGLLTPIGNPPLLAGLLRGVPFLWPARALFGVWLLASGLLLAIFCLTDWLLARTEPPPLASSGPSPARGRSRARVMSRAGWINAMLVLMMAGSIAIPHGPIPVALAAGAISLWITPRAVRRANDFSWHPMTEVAVLFAGIFITLEPVSELLRLSDGPFTVLADLARNEAEDFSPPICFWLTGLLSAFLDNAPSYLVFFDFAGIRPQAMTPGQAAALKAISAGSVMFGGLTYIGNASNLLLRTVASHRGVRMPGFVPFMLWAGLAMLPVLAVVSLVFFRG